jgi:hypothetical protein
MELALKHPEYMLSVVNPTARRQKYQSLIQSTEKRLQSAIAHSDRQLIGQLQAELEWLQAEAA